VPTPEETWNELLLELKAASNELYSAFVSLPGEARQIAAKAETRRYNEAVRRSDAINAKIKAFGAKVRRTKMRIDAR